MSRPTAGPTRIGVNLLWLVPGQVGGSEEYTVRLLLALADLRPADLDVTLFANGSLGEAHPALTDALPTVVAPVSGASRPLRVLAESTWLARETRRRGLAAVHHAGGTMPTVAPAPGLVTLHDLQPISHPERFSLLKRTYIRTAVPPSLRRARTVITLTDFTAADAVARCGIDPGRIRRVPSGIDRPGPPPSDERVAEVLGRYGLEGRRFVLYPAITYPHKNHETLVRAFARLAAERPDVLLVLTGGAGPSEAQVLAAVEALDLVGCVRRPGRIPADDLDVLYRTAAVVAFPSAYEGFGLPVLEAMAHGRPVVASDAGGLPSVVGHAAPLVPPYDAAAWAAALAAVLDDPAHAAALAEAGRRRAAAFPWRTSAEALADAYREAARPAGPPDAPHHPENR